MKRWNGATITALLFVIVAVGVAASLADIAPPTQSDNSFRWVSISNVNNPDFVVRNRTIYFKGMPFPEIVDIASFAVAVSGSDLTATVFFSKDEHHVYFANWPDVTIIPDADPSSFTPLLDSRGLIPYATDDYYVFYLPEIGYELPQSPVAVSIVALANSATFAPLYDAYGLFSGYARDATHIWSYLSPNPITGANPQSFVVVRGVIDEFSPGDFEMLSNGYGKDNQNVFSGNAVVPNADPKSFSAVYTSQGFFAPYADDKSAVYFDPGSSGFLTAIPGLDPATFRAEENNNGSFNGNARDATHRVHENKIIP